MKTKLMKFVDFVAKDTNAKNESKKTIVVIRVILLSIMVYFSANVVVGNVVSNVWKTVFCAGFLAVFIGIFSCTYYFRTRVALFFFNIAMGGFIVSVLYFFGVWRLLLMFSAKMGKNWKVSW